MPLLRSLSLCATLAVFFAAPATASASGAWRCYANGNIPIGTLTISGSSYEFIVTETTDFQTPRLDDPGTGSGTLTWQGELFTPDDGPLKDVFKITGATYPEGVSLNNGAGALMRCT